MKTRLRTTVHAFVALALLCIYGGTAYELRMRRDITLEAARAANLGKAQVLAEHVLHVVRGAELIHDHVIFLMQEKRLDGLSQNGISGEMWEQVNRFPEIVSVVVLDAKGDMRFSSHPSVAPPNASDREYFIRHAKGEDFVIGPPILHRVTGTEVFTLSRAVRGRNQELRAVVLVGVERAYFERLFAQRGSGDVVSLLRADGTILTRRPQVPPGERFPSTTPLFKMLPASDTGSYEAVSPLDGKQRLFAYARAGDYPLYILASEVRSEVLENWYKDAFVAVLVLLGATLALVSAALLVLRALTRESAARERIEQNEKFLGAVLDSMSAHMAILARDGRIVATNKAWREFAAGNGFSGASDMIGQNYLDVCRKAASADSTEVVAGISAVMLGTLREFEHDYECHSPQERRWFTMKVTALEGRKGSVLVSHEDVTRLMEIEELMRQRAETDALTGIANRRRFLEQATREFALACRHRRPLAVLMFDCDHFKHVNDRYGHEAGDIVLAAVARCAQDQLRSTDLVARLGGEEFAVLLPETGGEGAGRVAEQLRRAVEQLRLPYRDAVLTITISLGVAEAEPATPSFEDVLRAADQAMYEAKRRGRNQVVSGAVAATVSADPGR